jgi:hypothetical protein
MIPVWTLGSRAVLAVLVAEGPVAVGFVDSVALDDAGVRHPSIE